MADKFEHKPGSFSLFPNKYKDNDKKPDYKGTGKDLAGNDIEVAAWLRDAKEDGDPRWLSCSFKPKWQKQQDTPRQTAQESEHRTPPGKADGHPAMADLDSDIPFAPIASGIAGHAF